jgi:hypothetical protein
MSVMATFIVFAPLLALCFVMIVVLGIASVFDFIE